MAGRAGLKTLEESDMVLPPENGVSIAELALFTWS